MKEHSSQGRGILAALLLAVFAGASLNAADAKFMVVAKGQRWMQTNASAAVAVPGSNQVFMVSVDTSGPETVTNGSLILPNATVVPLVGEGDNHGGLEQMFASQGALDAAFPNGTYKIVIEGVNDGARTNAVSLTGNSYPATPYFNAFTASQAIDPNTDFNLTWDAIAGATAGDFINIEIVDCTDDHVASTPSPGQPNSLNGTSTNFVIRARSLRPGMMYKAKMIVAHFTTFDTNSYPGAAVTAGYLKEIFMPLTTTGTPVDCPPGRLQMVFNFPSGGFDATNGVISFPQALANYSAQLEVRYETNAPANITFTGPGGSGLNNTTNAWGNVNEWGAWFSSPMIPLPPFPPGGVYVVNYGGNNWSYNLLNPNAASQQLLIIPTIVLDLETNVTEVRWRFTDTNGVTVSAPAYVDEVSFNLDAMFGPIYQSNNGGEPLPRTATSHHLAFPVPWDAVSSVTMMFRDVAKNTFISSFHHESGPPNFEIIAQELPPGSVGRTYGATIQVNGGQSPYLWTIQSGSLPPGLTFSSETGTVSGQPNTPGTFAFNVVVADFNDQIAERAFAIVIFPNGGGGGETNGPDIRFFGAVKGQHWMQTNSGPAVADGGSNYIFMSFAEPNGPESLLSASITPPGGTPISLEGGFEDGFDFKALFASQGTLDAAFPSGDYAVVTEGVHDGSKTNYLLITGDAYPGTPLLSNFTAAQAIDPTADFTLTWGAIANANADDYLSVEIVDCQDEHVLSTSPPGKEDALKGTATNFVIHARTLRPGQQYKLKLFVVHFTTFDTNSYTGAMGVAGYLQETVIPLTTTGTSVGCPQGQLGFVFNFPAGILDGTNGSITFPLTLEHYSLHYEARGDTNPPQTITFTGPGGSGLNNTTNADRYAGDFGGSFSSPLVNVPPFPPGGVYTINYGGNNRSFNLLNPNAASQQVLLVPTVIVDGGNNVTEIRWRYADTNGNTISPPSFVQNVIITLHSTNGPLYQVGFGDMPLPGSSTAHPLAYPVPWEEVVAMQLQFRDPAANTFISTWNRGDLPPPGLSIVTEVLPPGGVGTNYMFTLQASGGEQPYLWTVQAGVLPAGLSLNPDTGEISGAPSSNGTTEFLIRVTDSRDQHADRSFVIFVSGGGDGGMPPSIRSFVLFKGQEFMQTGPGAPVPGTNSPFHFESFVEGNSEGDITNAVLRSPRGTNYVMEIEQPPPNSPARSGSGGEGGGGGGESFRIKGRYATKAALDAIYNSGNYTFFIATSDGSNRTANLNLPGDAYPATPHVANWLAAQSIDAFADFTLTWDAFTGATTNDFVQIQIEDENGPVFETNGPRQPDSLNGKSTSVVIPAETLAPGHEYKCSVFLARFSVVNTNTFPGALGIGAYAKATFIRLSTLTPPPPQGQFQFSAPTFSISETGTLALFTVTRGGGSEGAVSVDFSTSDGTAIADLDYVPTEGTLAFAEGETNVTFTFDILDDEIFETNETVRLTLSNPLGGASIGSLSNALMIITDNDTPGTAGLLQFSVASSVIGEASPTVTLTVSRTGGSAGEVTVDFITIDGSALGETDFTPDGGMLTFPAGVTSQTIVIGLNNDSFDETNETFEVMLDNPGGGASLGTRNVATVTITDNDTAGEIKFAATAVSVGEAAGEAVITLSRAGGTAEGVTVDVLVTDVTSTVDDDYSITTETVEFAAGVTTATFTLVITDDDSSEGDETLQLLLTNPTGGATLGRGTNVTVTIVDNEVSFQLSAESYTINEAGPAVVVTVTRSGPTTGTSTVDLSTTGGSAEGDADFVTTNSTITFGPGISSRTFPIRILNDDAVEEGETFTVGLSNPTGGQLGNLTEAVVSIVDNDVGGALSFTLTGFSVREQDPVALITVARTVGKAGGVTFDFTTENGSAEDGSDYTSVTETVTFAAGASSVVIEVPILNDGLDETNETVHLTISNPDGGATLGERNTATLTIVDNDTAGVISFSTASVKVGEPDGEALITITRTGGTADGVTVDVQVTDTTATMDDDYSVAIETVEFEAGSATATFPITVINDSSSEGDETLQLLLTNPTGGATLGKGTNVTVTIVDDEVSFQLSAESYTVNEGSPAAVLTVTRSGPTTGTSTVDYSTTSGSADADVDFIGTNGTVTFGPGVSSRTFTVRIIGDGEVEDEETFSVELGSPTGGQLGNLTEAVVSLVDNDLGGELNFKVEGFTVKEQAPFAVVVVTRTDGKASGVTFDFTTEDGSAEDGDDYTGVTETIEFEAGVSSVKIEVPIFNDAFDETNETVHLTISNPTGGATLGARDTATLTIIDNDTAGVIAFSAATYLITETGTTATVTITRSSGTAEGVTVDFITAGGTATPDVDFTAITNTLTFGSNEARLTFTIDIANDDDAEGNETVFMALSNPTGGGRLGTRTNAVLTIEDDEKSLQFSSATYEIGEGGRNLLVTVNRGGPLKGVITVQYATSDGTGNAGSDYTTRTGTLSFSSGSKSKTISIPILNDTTDEADETFTITLSNPTAGVLFGANEEATITIVDNDPSARIGRAPRR